MTAISDQMKNEKRCKKDDNKYDEVYLTNK